MLLSVKLSYAACVVIAQVLFELVADKCAVAMEMLKRLPAGDF